MKTAFAFLLSLLFISLQAQDCSTSLLFKKGAVLTYKNYIATGGMFKLDYTEMTRLVYTVTEVKDSGNNHYSYITKTGINPKNESQRYEKNYVVMCTESQLFIPADFYITDTIYFSNRYPDSKDKGFYATTSIKGNLKYQFPTDVEKGKFQLSSNQMITAIKSRDYDYTPETPGAGGRTMGGYRSGRIIENSLEIEVEIKKLDATGNETIKTDAGTYKCRKIQVDGEVKNMKVNSGLSGSNSSMYYNPIVGLVRSESGYKKKIFSYMELAGVK
jgi:hypothetical protein